MEQFLFIRKMEDIGTVCKKNYYIIFFFFFFFKSKVTNVKFNICLKLYYLDIFVIFIKNIEKN
jgi:hypothetical protein